MTFAQNGILLAILAQGALALLLLAVLGRRRLPRVAAREVQVADVALSDKAWPEDAQKASNAFNNQFQLPVLFYVAAGLALYLGANVAELALAWLFVASRCIHAAIHITNNQVYRRFAAYVTGYVILCLLWAELTLRVLMGIWT